MSVLRVIDPGLFTTVQDLGRVGFASQGVPESGAADPIALRLANRLAGNADGAPALEMTLRGGEYLLERDTTIAIAGAPMPGTLLGPDGTPRALAPNAAAHIRAGERLRLAFAPRGARAYLSIRGGFRVPLVLASASTHAPSGLGGFQGRPLRAGDAIEFGDAIITTAAASPSSWSTLAALVEESLTLRTLRCTPGVHADRFDAESRHTFFNAAFAVTNHADRMGVRLEGPPLRAPAGGRLLSEGMTCGGIQVPEQGQPIALLVDHPTTGGYPVIACVASVDLHVLGQLRPRDAVRFELITHAEARRLAREREASIHATSHDAR